MHQHGVRCKVHQLGMGCKMHQHGVGCKVHHIQSSTSLVLGAKCTTLKEQPSELHSQQSSQGSTNKTKAHDDVGRHHAIAKLHGKQAPIGPRLMMM